MSTIENREYFLYLNDKNEGPFSFDQVKFMLTNKKIDYTTYIFYEGLKDWINLGELEEFSNRKLVRPPPPKKQQIVKEESDLWVLLINEEESESVSKEEVIELLNSKQIRQSTFARKETDEEWQKLNECEEFKEYFGSKLKVNVRASSKAQKESAKTYLANDPYYDNKVFPKIANSKFTWNWRAGIFGGYWFLYKGMIREWLTCVITFAFINEVMPLFSGPAGVFGSAVGFMIYLGHFGNQEYYKRISKGERITNKVWRGVLGVVLSVVIGAGVETVIEARYKKENAPALATAESSASTASATTASATIETFINIKTPPKEIKKTDISAIVEKFENDSILYRDENTVTIKKNFKWDSQTLGFSGKSYDAQCEIKLDNGIITKITSESFFSSFSDYSDQMLVEYFATLKSCVDISLHFESLYLPRLRLNKIESIFNKIFYVNGYSFEYIKMLNKIVLKVEKVIDPNFKYPYDIDIFDKDYIYSFYNTAFEIQKTSPNSFGFSFDKISGGDPATISCVYTQTPDHKWEVKGEFLGGSKFALKAALGHFLNGCLGFIQSRNFLNMSSRIIFNEKEPFGRTFNVDDLFTIKLDYEAIEKGAGFINHIYLTFNTLIPSNPLNRSTPTKNQSITEVNAETATQTSDTNSTPPNPPPQAVGG